MRYAFCDLHFVKGGIFRYLNMYVKFCSKLGITTAETVGCERMLSEMKWRAKLKNLIGFPR